MTDDHVITDHALLRYIERVLGGNIKEMKDAVLSPRVQSAVNVGALSVIENGFKYVIRGGKVVTVLDKDARLKG